MTHAVVLGGGGAVGTAWQTGLIAGWARAGVTVKDADLILGTSAGAAVGVQLALGQDLDRQVERFQLAHERRAAGRRTAVPHLDAERSRLHTERFARWNATAGADRAVREEIGRVARGTPVGQDLLDGFRYLREESWPPNYACTVLDVDSAEVVVLDTGAAADLQHGVTAAVSVPGVYTPVSVAGRRCADAGSVSATHLDRAASHRRILFVRMTHVPAAERDAVRTAGADLCEVTPDVDAMAAFRGNAMNADLVLDAAERGLRQGARTAAAVGAFWSAGTVM